MRVSSRTTESWHTGHAKSLNSRSKSSESTVRRGSSVNSFLEVMGLRYDRWACRNSLLRRLLNPASSS